VSRFIVIAAVVLSGSWSGVAHGQMGSVARSESIQDRARSLSDAMSDRAGATTTTLPYSQTLVFMTLQVVYASLGLPVSVMNPDSGVVGTSNFYLSSPLAHRPPSNYFDCGASSTVPGSQLDEYRTTISVFSEAVGDSTSTTLATWTSATGRSSGSVNAEVVCHSNGRLEKLIAKAVADQLKK
jgi:hypothetical protein